MLFQGLSLRLPVARNEKELKHVCQVVKQGKALYNENPVEFIPGEGKPRLSIPMKMNETRRETLARHLDGDERNHSFHVVSRWKELHNETAVEFITGEGKPWRGISMEMNEMFSVTPCSFQTEKDLKHSFHVVSRWKALYNETPVEFITGEDKQRRGDKNDSVMLFQGLSLRLPVARTEKELKHVCQVVKQGKALYNENPVEFIPGEGKPRLSIPMKMNETRRETLARHLDGDERNHSFHVVSRWKELHNETAVEFITGEGKPWRGISMEMNEMFSVTPCSFQTEKDLKHSFHVVSRWKALYNETPVEFITGEDKQRRGIPMEKNIMLSVTLGSILMVSVNQTEREADFIYCYTTSHFFIISLHILIETQQGGLSDPDSEPPDAQIAIWPAMR
ncbi:hypothetical protein T01_4086, partial [Trichinella spiralis]